MSTASRRPSNAGWWTTSTPGPGLVHGSHRGCAEAAYGSRGLRDLTGARGGHAPCERLQESRPTQNGDGAARTVM